MGAARRAAVAGRPRAVAVRAGALAALAVIASAGSADAAAPVTAASRPLTGFLSQPTEQLAVPGELAAGEITPQGDVYTGSAEYQPFTGSALRAWDQPTRVTPDPGEPLYQSQRRQGDVRYVERVFTVQAGGEPVAYLTLGAINLTARRRPARVAMQLEYDRGRPIATYFPGHPASPFRFPRGLGAPGGDGVDITDPGVAFDPAWTYAVSGRDVTRDGRLLLRGPSARATPLRTAGDGLSSPHAGLAYATTLPAHGRASWSWQIPLTPPPAGPATDAALDAASVTHARAAFTAAWRGREAGAMTVSVPEPRVDALYRESLVDILAARDRSPALPGGWYQAVNKFQYQGFWLRDSSIMTVALDQAGLHGPAAQNLGSLPAFQQPDGLYISQSGQLDGVGQALWEMGQHAQLAGAPGYATSVLAPVAAAVNWIAGQSAADPNGLLGPTTIDDDEMLTDARVTGDEVWAAVGLRSAVTLARSAGRGDLVAAWQAIDRRFEAHLRAALRADQAGYGHITPGLGTGGGHDWGNYDLDYPVAIVPLHGGEVNGLIAWERAHSTQGLADYAHTGFLHDYLGFPIFQTELRRGGASVTPALAGFYAETIHTTASGGGWEDGPRGYRVRDSTDNLAPHGTFSGQYVSLLHNLLVDDTGSRIDLLAGVSPAWMRAGDHVAVARAATSAGPVSLRLTATATGATLRWSLRRVPGDAEGLWWTLPYWVPAARLPDGRRVRGALRLDADRGTVALRWSARAPAQSLAAAVTALDRAYTRRGLTAPLRPAADW